MSARTIVVTGAGRGIGRWTARAFAATGDRVALLGRDADQLDAVASEVRDLGGEALPLPVDLASPDRIEACFTTLDERWGRLDVLVNNAARYDHHNSAWAYSLAEWRDIIDVNVTGSYLCSRAAARLMIRGGRGGRIVNVGAIQQWAPLEGWIAYATSKGAVSSMTRSLAVELGRFGILVNAVAPGGVDARADDATDGASDGPSATLLGRLGHPREVADVIWFLASESCTFITGEVIRCDGGRLLMPRTDPQDSPCPSTNDEEEP